MRLYSFLSEQIWDSGKAGKKFEEVFKQALNMIGLRYVSNSATGTLWDIQPVGDGWVKRIGTKEVNIKVASTKWMFGSAQLYQMLPWDNVPEDFNKELYQKRVKRFLNSIDLPSVVFLKCKSVDIQEQIIEAVKSEDTEMLDKLFDKKNFQYEKLGKQYDVRILTRKGKITSIAIDKGG